MQLPESDELDISRLAAVFSDTTNSYKFYWLLAILDGLRETGQTRFSMRDLSLRMVANVWYPLYYFKLSFGKQDGFKPIADFVSERIIVDNRPTAPTLFSQLNARLSATDLTQLHRRVSVLLNWVPYRFIRPFFAQETRGLLDQHVNARIVELASQSEKVPYHFIDDEIELNNKWAAYLQQHQAILRGFTSWHLVRFLQKNNPNVIGLTEKLEKPGVRMLNTANKFWKEYLKENPKLRCVYSGQLITTANLSLDHFLPWSFVAHDQIWNIIPTPKPVNSAKNDWLPSVDLYFNSYVQQQFDGFQFHVSNGHDKLLEDYSVLFGQSLNTIQQQPFSWFRERLERAVLPQLQTAQNLGFSYPFEYKKSDPMLTDSDAQRVSKFLSLVLRHQPETIGIILDENGWTDVDVLLTKLQTKGHRINRDQLRHLVETNNKKRFAFNSDETRIRASQGHSVDVDLGYTEKQPPEFLYHGTATRFLDVILAEGLKKMDRHHVHLSADEPTARNVGSRHGKPVVLAVKAEEMAANNFVFYQSENGVWLTEFVPAAYIVHE